MLQRGENEPEPINSSTNFLKEEEVPLYKSKVTNLNTEGCKQLRIGSIQQEQTQPSGVPSFIGLIPFLLWNILKQGHIIYFIFLSIVLYFKYCSGDLGNVITHTCFLTFEVIMEMVYRYLTYKSYYETSKIEDETHEFWCWEKQQWVTTSQNNFQVGQVIKLNQNQKYSQKRIKIPVSLLPLAVSSGAKQITVDSFAIDKTEGTTNIPIFSQFEYNFSASRNYINPKIQNIRVLYTFHNPNSQSFQAKIIFDERFEKKNINNGDSLKKGAFCRNEDFLIGVVLFNLGNHSTKNLLRMLDSENKLNSMLKKHLLQSILFNSIFAMVCMGAYLLIIHFEAKIKLTYNDTCFPVNLLSTLSYSLNLMMFMQLSIHRFLDSIFIFSISKTKMKNYIKAIDQFGIADTFVMDEFSFIKKNGLKLEEITISEDSKIHNFDKNMIIATAYKSRFFKQKFSNNWYALTNFMKKNPYQTLQIEDETIDIDESIFMLVSFKNEEKKNRFLVKFSEKIILSVLESITIERQLEFWEKIDNARSNGDMLMMMEITELYESGPLNINSSNRYKFTLKLHCFLKFKFIIDYEAARFIKEIQNKYNIVMMTSNPLQDFQKALVAAELKNEADKIHIFQQTDEAEFRKDLKQLLLQFQKFYLLKHNKDKDKPILQQEVQSKIRLAAQQIIAFDSSLITYLTRSQIKETLRKLSSQSVYIIFYNCCQFQKEFCAASIFKIFEEHIFISNFAIDANIFRVANLSISILGRSAERYATAIAQNYSVLKQFITKQCPTSIELTSIIIKNNIFKNQALIFSLITVFFLVYRGRMPYIGLQYTTFLFVMYNFLFTIIPMMYYIMRRPDILQDILVQNFKNQKLVNEHFKGILSGLLMTLFTYAFIPSVDMHNIFSAVLINCTIMANFHYLVMDYSVSKKPQIISIIVQCIISLLAYLITLYLVPSLSVFYLGLQLSPLFAENFLFYIGVFLVNPVVIGLWLFFLAFQKKLYTRNQHRKEKKDIRKSTEQISSEGVKVHVGKCSGKQMRFRSDKENE